jgi:hypothetical protein
VFGSKIRAPQILLRTKQPGEDTGTEREAFQEMPIFIARKGLLAIPDLVVSESRENVSE